MARSFKRDTLGRWHDRATGWIVSPQTVRRSRQAVKATEQRKRSKAARKGWETRRKEEAARATVREQTAGFLQWATTFLRTAVLPEQIPPLLRGVIPIPLVPPVPLEAIFPPMVPPFLPPGVPPVWEPSLAAMAVGVQAFELDQWPEAANLPERFRGVARVEITLHFEHVEKGISTTRTITFEGTDDPAEWWRRYFAAVREANKEFWQEQVAAGILGPEKLRGSGAVWVVRVAAG